jgi:LysR family glycine cleavage system transcriptional activator
MSNVVRAMVDSLNLTLGKFGPSKLARLEHVGFDSNRLRKSLPPLQTLIAFEAAARLKSFTLASVELSLSQPAISQQIRLLEERLGLPLFERANNQIAVTLQGEVLAKVVSEMLARLADTVEEIKTEGGRSTLSVSLLPSFASTWFASRAGQFERDNPNVDLIVLSTVACVEFEHEEVDVAIRWGRGGWSSDLYEEKLLDESFIVVASPQLLKASGPISSIEELANVPFVHDTNYNEWKTLIELNGGDPASLSKGLYFGDSSATIATILSGHGVGVVRDVLVGHFLAKGLLTRLPFEPVRGPLSYYFLCPRERVGRPSIKSFLAWLRRELNSSSSQ